MEIIYILKSKYSFYIIIFLCGLSNFIYKAMVKNIRKSLDLNEHMFSSEIWEMIKEESKNGNVKAKIAVFAYYSSTVLLFILGVLICLVNVDV